MFQVYQPGQGSKHFLRSEVVCYGSVCYVVIHQLELACGQAPSGPRCAVYLVLGLDQVCLFVTARVSLRRPTSLDLNALLLPEPGTLFDNACFYIKKPLLVF